MKYKDFYEGYPYGGFPVDKSDFKSVTPSTPEEEDEEGDEITIRGPRVSNYVEESKGPCWDGYEMVGKKMKNGKEVPNCVPIKEASTLRKIVREIINEVLDETPRT